MSFTSPEFILGVFGALGLGGFGVALLTLRPSRRKLQGEAAKLYEEAKKQGADSAAVLTSTAISLLGPMKIEIKDLNDQVDTLTDKLEVTTKNLEETTEKLNKANTELDEALKVGANLRLELNQMRRELEIYRRIAREHYGTELPDIVPTQDEMELGSDNG